MRRLRLTIGVSAAAALLVFLAPASPALAASTEHSITDGVVSDNGGSAAVDPVGLRFTTPVNGRSNFNDYLFAPAILAELAKTPPNLAALANLQSFVPFAHVGAMSYKTKKYDTDGGPVILPAYKIELFCGPTRPYTTLVYEPYLQTPAPNPNTFGGWLTWDVDAGLFWSTFALSPSFGGPVGNPNRDVLKPLGDIKALCPLGVVLSIGVGQGASQQKAEAAADELRFAGKQITITQPGDAQTLFAGGVEAQAGLLARLPDIDKVDLEILHTWRKKVEVTQTPGGGPIQMAPTGLEVTTYVIAGTALVGVGIVMLLVARRRRGITEA